MRKPFVVTIDRIEMDIAIFCAQTDHAVGFECGVKGQSQTVNQLRFRQEPYQLSKSTGLSLNLFVANRSQQQLLKMVVLGLAIRFFGVDAEINRITLAIFTHWCEPDSRHRCRAPDHLRRHCTALYHLD